MKSTAETVSAYVAEQPKDWRPTLKQLRALCRAQLPGYREKMAYGMPSYERDGEVAVSFAKQASYLSLYALNQAVFEAYRPQLAGLSLGKGCIRYRRPEQVDWKVVSALLAETCASHGDVC
jgi:uncharacterized protein YdhG (YjbR/CyaY superfamily)